MIGVAKKSNLSATELDDRQPNLRLVATIAPGWTGASERRGLERIRRAGRPTERLAVTLARLGERGPVRGVSPSAAGHPGPRLGAGRGDEPRRE